MVETKTRIAWADCAKFVCIMFVMLSHLEANTDVLLAFYQPFFLSTFFFVSGYVYKHGGGFCKLIVKKAKGLLLPWFIFSLLNIIASQILSFNKQGSLVSELSWNFLQIRGKGDEIWFLPALFLAFVPFYFFVDWYKKSKLSIKKKAVLITAVSFSLSLISLLYTKLMNPMVLPWESVALPWHFEYFLQAAFFMWLGYLFKEFAEKYFDKINRFVMCITLLAIYLGVVYIPEILQINKDAVAFSVVYNYVSAILGIGVVVAFCKIIKLNKYISYIGQNTIICFALHGKVYSLIQTLLHKFADSIYTVILENTLYSILFSVVFTILLSLILIIPAYIINRWFPFVLGKSLKKAK